MGYLSESVNYLDLVYAVYARTKTSMHAEDLVVDDAGQA